MWRSDLPPSQASVAVNPSSPAQGDRARGTRSGRRIAGHAGKGKGGTGRDTEQDGPSAAQLAALDALGPSGTWEALGAGSG